jgi:hypothetical protein
MCGHIQKALGWTRKRMLGSSVKPCYGTSLPSFPPSLPPSLCRDHGGRSGLCVDTPRKHWDGPGNECLGAQSSFAEVGRDGGREGGMEGGRGGLCVDAPTKHWHGPGNECLGSSVKLC